MTARSENTASEYSKAKKGSRGNLLLPRIARIHKPCPLESGNDRHDHNELQDDSRRPRDEVAAHPRGQRVGPLGEDQSLQRTADEASHDHGAH